MPADESFEAVAVVPLDADRGVDAESARSLPCEHVGCRGLIEEVVATEVAEDALLNRPLELLPVARFELRGLVEFRPTLPSSSVSEKTPSSTTTW